MKMLLLYVLSICLSLWMSGSSSVGSDSESLLTCSKFHFEEKVLEKLVRLEHKMEINEEKIKLWEDAFSAKLDKMDKAITQTETFVESIRESNLRELSRLNDSFLETVGTFKIQSNNETNIYGEEMHTILESLSSKTKEFIVAEENRKSAHELMQYTIHQEQKRFNQSFDRFLENTKHTSNKTIHEMFGKQQKVAVTACVSSGQIFSDSVVRFSTLSYKIGIDNIEIFKSSGKFVCEIPGLYYISAHIRTTSQDYAFYVRKTGTTIARSASDSGNPYSANPISAVIELQLGDTLYVFAPSVNIQGTYSCVSIIKVG